MKAAVLTGRRKIEVTEVAAAEPAPGEVLVAVKYAGICGTDAHIYAGEFESRVAYPTVMGHEFAGIVEAVGPGVRSAAAGDKVAVDPIIPCRRCVACREGSLSACRNLKLLGVDLDGAFAERVAVGADQVFKLPERVTLRQGATLEIFSVGIHALRRARVEPADVVVVLGAGRLGLALLSVLTTTAAGTIVVSDVKEYRLDIARKIGAHYCINAAKKDVVSEVRALTDGRGADRIIEAVGEAAESASGLQPVAEAVEMVRSAGRIVVLGQGPESTPVFWRPFVWKEATLVASRVSRGEFPRAISMIESGTLDPAPFITHEVPLDYVPEAFRMIEEGAEPAVKVLVKIE